MGDDKPKKSKEKRDKEKEKKKEKRDKKKNDDEDDEIPVKRRTIEVAPSTTADEEPRGWTMFPDAWFEGATEFGTNFESFTLRSPHNPKIVCIFRIESGGHEMRNKLVQKELKRMVKHICDYGGGIKETMARMYEIDKMDFADLTEVGALVKKLNAIVQNIHSLWKGSSIGSQVTSPIWKGNIISKQLAAEIVQGVLVRAISHGDMLDMAYRGHPFASDSQTLYDHFEGLLPVLKMSDKDVFVDITAGFGMMPMWLACMTQKGTIVGIESNDLYAGVQEQIKAEFAKTCKWYGKIQPSMLLEHGDFSHQRWRNMVLNSATILFVNNIDFDNKRERAFRGMMKGLDMSDPQKTLRIITTRPIFPLDKQRESKRDLSAFLDVYQLQNPKYQPNGKLPALITFYEYRMTVEKVINFACTRPKEIAKFKALADALEEEEDDMGLIKYCKTLAAKRPPPPPARHHQHHHVQHHHVPQRIVQQAPPMVTNAEFVVVNNIDDGLFIHHQEEVITSEDMTPEQRLDMTIQRVTFEAASAAQHLPPMPLEQQKRLEEDFLQPLPPTPPVVTPPKEEKRRPVVKEEMIEIGGYAFPASLPQQPGPSPAAGASMESLQETIAAQEEWIKKIMGTARLIEDIKNEEDEPRADDDVVFAVPALPPPRNKKRTSPTKTPRKTTGQIVAEQLSAQGDPLVYETLAQKKARSMQAFASAPTPPPAAPVIDEQIERLLPPILPLAPPVEESSPPQPLSVPRYMSIADMKRLEDEGKFKVPKVPPPRAHQSPAKVSPKTSPKVKAEPVEYKPEVEFLQYTIPAGYDLVKDEDSPSDYLLFDNLDDPKQEFFVRQIILWKAFMRKLGTLRAEAITQQNLVDELDKKRILAQRLEKEEFEISQLKKVGMEHLRARLKEIGMEDVKTPTELLAKSKQIVIEHKEATARAAELEKECIELERDLRNMVPCGSLLIERLPLLMSAESTPLVKGKDNYGVFIAQCTEEYRRMVKGRPDDRCDFPDMLQSAISSTMPKEKGKKQREPKKPAPRRKMGHIMTEEEIKVEAAAKEEVERKVKEIVSKVNEVMVQNLRKRPSEEKMPNASPAKKKSSGAGIKIEEISTDASPQPGPSLAALAHELGIPAPSLPGPSVSLPPPPPPPPAKFPVPPTMMMQLPAHPPVTPAKPSKSSAKKASPKAKAPPPAPPSLFPTMEPSSSTYLPLSLPHPTPVYPKMPPLPSLPLSLAPSMPQSFSSPQFPPASNSLSSLSALSSALGSPFPMNPNPLMSSSLPGSLGSLPGLGSGHGSLPTNPMAALASMLTASQMAQLASALLPGLGPLPNLNSPLGPMSFPRPMTPMAPMPPNFTTPRAAPPPAPSPFAQRSSTPAMPPPPSFPRAETPMAPPPPPQLPFGLPGLAGMPNLAGLPASIASQFLQMNPMLFGFNTPPNNR